MAKMPFWYFSAIAVLLLAAFSNQVFGAKRELVKTGSKAEENIKNSGDKWWSNDKWYPSDTVYIDDPANHGKEGSGAGMVHSDLVETGSGGGPDDEDSVPVQGSGDHDVFVDTTDVIGSGDGVWIDRTIRPRPSSTTTVKPLWFRPQQPDTAVAKTTERPWWPQPTSQATTTTKIRGVTVFTDEDESNVIDEFATEAPEDGETPTAPFNVVPTDSTIYDQEPRTLNPFLRPGILAAVIGGAVVGLLAAILLVMFIVYRMRKKDEGSYALDEPKQPPSYPYAYQKAPTKEFYA